MKSDLELRHEPFRSLTIAQNQFIDKAFKKLKTSYKPSKIIELGTAHGGMAAWLADLFKCPIITYDNKEWGDVDILRYRRKLYKELNVDFRIMDVVHEQLRFRIAEDFDERTILLCDNGLKETEFQIYGKMIKSGGIIMAHDYGESKDHFDKEIRGKYWNHFEFDGSKFDGYCKEHNLEPYLQDEFTKAVWFIRIKK